MLAAHRVTVNNETCQPDQYEEDDSAESATPLTLGTSQAHNFCFDNADWLSFSATAGSVYKVSTSSLGTEADTQLILYDRDGSSILLFDDNARHRPLDIDPAVVETDGSETLDMSGGFPPAPRSEIVWEAEFSGTYFVKVRTTSCDEDLDNYCVGPEDNAFDSEFFGIGGSPDGVGLNTEYTISLQ